MPAPWNHNIQYHGTVLRAMPSPCRVALDVGCGRGMLARQIAEAGSAEVTGIDMDRDSVVAAMAVPGSSRRISYVQGDVMAYPFSGQQFDFVTAVATLHHLPLRPGLLKLRELLQPGGVLAIVGLYRSTTLGDYAMAAAALPASRLLRIIRKYEEVGAPMQAPDQTIGDIQAASREILPGAIFRRLLLFRYLLIWKKPR